MAIYSMIPETVFSPVIWRLVDDSTKLLFFELWGLATRCDARGAFVHGTGKPYTLDDIAFELRRDRDTPAFLSAVGVLTDLEMIGADADGGFFLIAFREVNPTTQAERRQAWAAGKRAKRAASVSTEQGSLLSDDQDKDDQAAPAVTADDLIAEPEPPQDDPILDVSEMSKRHPKDINETSAGSLSNVKPLNINIKVKDKSKSKSKSKRLRDSVESRPRERDPFFDRLAEITKLSPEIYGSRIGNAKTKLLKINATLQELNHFADWWPVCHWQGQRGDYPTPEQVCSEWLKAKAWNGQPPATPARSYQSSGKSQARPQATYTDEHRAALREKARAAQVERKERERIEQEKSNAAHQQSG